MKNKVLKVLLATMLMVSMVGTTVMAAETTETSTTTGGTITGTSTVENPVYKLVVPANLNFAIDPFEQGGQTGSQIYSTDRQLINKSNVPVRVDLQITATAADGVSLKTAAEVATVEANTADTSKVAYLAVEVPGAVTETKAAAANYLDNTGASALANQYTITGATGANVDYNGRIYTATATLADGNESAATPEMINVTAVAGDYTTKGSAKVDISATAKKFTFVLDGADYTEIYTNYNDAEPAYKAYKANAADTKGSAVFRFHGNLNTKAAWAANDVKADATYTFLGLSATNYTALSAKGIDTSVASNKTHGYIVEAEDATFTSTEIGKVSYTEGTDAKKFVKLLSAKATYAGQETDFLASLTVDTANKTISMTEEFAGFFAADEECGVDGFYTFTFVYDTAALDDADSDATGDNVTKTVKIKVKNVN